MREVAWREKHFRHMSTERELSERGVTMSATLVTSVQRPSESLEDWHQKKAAHAFICLYIYLLFNLFLWKGKSLGPGTQSVCPLDSSGT